MDVLHAAARYMYLVELIHLCLHRCCSLRCSRMASSKHCRAKSWNSMARLETCWVFSHSHFSIVFYGKTMVFPICPWFSMFFLRSFPWYERTRVMKT